VVPFCKEVIDKEGGESTFSTYTLYCFSVYKLSVSYALILTIYSPSENCVVFHENWYGVDVFVCCKTLPSQNSTLVIPISSSPVTLIVTVPW